MTIKAGRQLNSVAETPRPRASRSSWAFSGETTESTGSTLESLGDLDPVQVEGVQDLVAGELLVLGPVLQPLGESGPLDVVGPHPGPFKIAWAWAGRKRSGSFSRSARSIRL